MLSGFLLIDRAPGNFHIQAQSRSHDLDPFLTNISHTINQLSFGRPMSKYFQQKGLNHVPPEFLASTRPFDGNTYVTQKEHEAHHHYLKVVTTEFDADKAAPKVYNKNKKKYEADSGMTRAYQILQSSQLSAFEQNVVPGEWHEQCRDYIQLFVPLLWLHGFWVPHTKQEDLRLFLTEAKFTYDLSPIAVSYERNWRKWYDYLTSVMAIIGGTFTVVGMLESSIDTVTSKKRR